MAEKLNIFISGTMRDMSTERERVAAAIRDMGLEPVWAEKRGATDRPSHDECERMARTCHVYLGLYGLSYGWKFPPEETISATEFEWQMAKRAGTSQARSAGRTVGAGGRARDAGERAPGGEGGAGAVGGVNRLSPNPAFAL
jgi:hypothetical protein